MPRVVGIDIPADKRLLVSLTYIRGIGRPSSEKLMKALHFDLSKRAKDLTPEEISQLNRLIQKEYTVEGDLAREVQNNIKRLISVRSYRGLRHRLKLPVRGQKTQKNSRTRKGKKKTIANKKK